MNCLICGTTEMNPYFDKKYDDSVHSFLCCHECGLVINKTVYEMSSAEFKQINDWHKLTQGSSIQDTSNFEKRCKRLEPQADLIARLFFYGIFEEGMKAVDFGGGDGLFSEMCNKKYTELKQHEPQHLLIKTYEKFLMQDKKDLYFDVSDMIPKSFDLVISSAVLEHMIGEKEINDFFELTKNNGTVIFHTLICEKVPRDPDWFYIRKPVHCTLWTNRAMSKLYNKYGYVGCAYHLPSKMWLFFNDDIKFNLLKKCKDNIPGKWSFSKHFVDYWKNEPYHEGEK